MLMRIARVPVILDKVADRLDFAKPWSFDCFASAFESIRVQRPSEDGLYHYLNFERIPFSDFRGILKPLFIQLLDFRIYLFQGLNLWQKNCVF